MAFTGIFSSAQSISDVILTDESTGSDPTITTRHAFFQRSDGSYITPAGSTTDYVDWPIDDVLTLTVDLLTRDYALNITVVWVTPTPDPAGVYTLTLPEFFQYYGRTFLYGLTQEQQVARPKIISWNDYLANKFLLWCYYLEAYNAIYIAGDIVNSQGCLNSAYNMMANQNQYWGSGAVS